MPCTPHIRKRHRFAYRITAAKRINIKIQMWLDAARNVYTNSLFGTAADACGNLICIFMQNPIIFVCIMGNKFFSQAGFNTAHHSDTKDFI